uniref:Uncharacterized protein n=1 Tax=Oryza meridionalis TaxID=40149 RepID=A0A0E0DJ13_9ORYZ
MAVQCSPVFLFPASMLALPAGALVGVSGAAFVAMIEAAAFEVAMEAFEDTFRPLALVSGNEKVAIAVVENVLKEVMVSADGCGQLLRVAIHVVPITQEQLQELIGAGESFATLSGECREGYLRAAPLVGAIEGAKRMCTVLSARIKFLPMDTVSGNNVDDLDKEKYFTNLSEEFYCLYDHMRRQLYRHQRVEK